MSDQPQSQPLTCAVCGSPLEPDDRFCRICGAPVPVSAAPSDPDQETRQAPVVDPAGAELWLPPSAVPDVEAVDVSEEILVEPAEAAVDDVDDLWTPVSATPAPIEAESAVIEETIYAAEPVSATDEAAFAAAPPPLDAPAPSSATPYAAPPPMEQAAGGGNRMWWIIGGIVLFFFLVCCCLAIGIAAVANADTGFQDELRGTAGLLLSML